MIEARSGGFDYKACCAALYEHDAVRFLLGDSWRPGGGKLTEGLALAAGLTEADLVLDLACGSGGSARLIGTRFACHVVGLDLAIPNLKAIVGQSSPWGGPGCPPDFVGGDAERLPFADSSFDAVVCECAVSTFADKQAALREIGRVLCAGGRVCLTDVTLSPGSLPDELDSLFGRIACLGGALPLEGYEALLEESGFEVLETRDVDEAAGEFLRSIDRKLGLARIMQAVGKLDLGDTDLAAARRVLKTGLNLVAEGKLSYGLLIARRP